MKKLLIVEDDTNTLNGLIELFRGEGYWVFGERRLADARRTAREYHVDIVLADYRLPDGDGLQLCAELKKLQPGIACYLATAWLSSEICAVALQNGIKRVFHKPVAIDELLSEMEVEGGELVNKPFPARFTMAGLHAF